MEWIQMAIYAVGLWKVISWTVDGAIWFWNDFKKNYDAYGDKK